MKKILFLIALFTGAIFTYVPVSDVQAAWPDKPVYLYVRNPPGGGSDTFCRVLAAAMEKELGVKVIVGNKTGGMGVDGENFVWDAPHDGYTWTSINHGFMGQGDLKGKKLKLSDWSFCIGAGSPFIFAVNPKTGIKNMEDFLKVIKEREIKIAVSGNDLPRWQGNLLAKNYKVRVVPYTGGGPAILGALSGEADVVALGLGDMAQHFRAGKLVPICVTTSSEAIDFNEKTIPAIRAEIPELAQHDNMNAFQGIMFPADVPEVVQTRINKAFNKAITTPQFLDYLKKQNLTPMDLTGEKALKFIENYDKNVHELIQQFNKGAMENSASK